MALAFVPASRRAALRAAGWALVAEDPIQTADAIVIAVDSRESGVLEAADLVNSGVSRTVALFASKPDDIDREFVRRGIVYEDEATRQVRLLRALGVANIDLISLPIGGTEDEGRIFPAWCEARQVRSVVVVANPDHTRRLRRVLHRAMKGQATAVMVRRSRYAEFEPDRWWVTRDGARTGIVELEKLLFDVIRHPIS